MKHSLKIAVYSGEIPSTTFIERLITGLSSSPHRVYLFGAKTGKTSYNRSVTVVGYTHNRLRKFLHLLTYTFLLSIFKSDDKRKLDRILKNQSNNLLYSKVKSYPVLWHCPDIFHLQWAKGIEEWAWVQDFGIKLVVSLRGAHINYSPIAKLELAEMYRTYFPKVDGFHAVSRAMAKEANNYGAPVSKIKVVYSGLNLVSFQSDAKSQKGIFEILSVGRPHWIKGYVYAIDACKLLKAAGLKFHYYILGGSDDIELAYHIHDLDLQDCITVVPQQSFETVKKMIHSADLLLLPSAKEGIANVVLEAMALGTMVLSTDCGGMDEVISDGKNGFLVPIRNPKAIANAVLKISQLDASTNNTILKAAKRTVEDQHDEGRMIEEMVGLYELTVDG